VPSDSTRRIAAAVRVIPGAREGLDRGGRLPVHHFKRRRNDAGGDHRGDRGAGAVNIGERKP